jgi:hypothetical protein
MVASPWVLYGWLKKLRVCLAVISISIPIGSSRKGGVIIEGYAI